MSINDLEAFPKQFWEGFFYGKYCFMVKSWGHSLRSVNKYDIITKEPKERIEMITKEDYQLIRSHPAFSEIPVEKFDKLAVEIHYREIPKGQILFLPVISAIEFF